MLDRAVLEAFLDKALGDIGSLLTAGLVVIGERLGLYKAMAALGPVDAAGLAQETGTNERYVAEWLAAQAAAGYVLYDPSTCRFTLPAEHAAALADDRSSVSMLGGYRGMLAALQAIPQLVEAFRTGEGVGWDTHPAELSAGVGDFFRPAYTTHLVGSWIPALEGVESKLKAGAAVADVGCGIGDSTLLMARAYPRSRFLGVDYHLPSIERARAESRRLGLDQRCAFEVAAADQLSRNNFALITLFDCLHDMGDPVGVAGHLRGALTPDGTLLLVEPYASDRLEDNLTPVGRIYYSASTLICTPASLAQHGRTALGAQAGPSKLIAILTQAGFANARVVKTTRFHLVIEARATGAWSAPD